MPATDDDGFTRKVGIVAFFHAGIERIAVHMGDGQIEKFRVRYLTRTATRGAAGSTIKGGQAVFAKCRHGAKIRRARARHNG